MSEFTTPDGTRIVIKPDGYNKFTLTKCYSGGHVLCTIEPNGIKRIYVNGRLEFDADLNKTDR